MQLAKAFGIAEMALHMLMSDDFVRAREGTISTTVERPDASTVRGGAPNAEWRSVDLIEQQFDRYRFSFLDLEQLPATMPTNPTDGRAAIRAAERKQ